MSEPLRALLIRYPIFAERRLPVILQPEGDTATLDYPSALEHLAEHLRDPFGTSITFVSCLRCMSSFGADGDGCSELSLVIHSQKSWILSLKLFYRLYYMEYNWYGILQ